MPERNFDLGDYVEVKDRIAILYEFFPQARVETDYELTREPDDKPKVIVRARVYRAPEDPEPAGKGTSWMYLPGTTSFTKGSEIENAETSAVGRAIGMMGILIDRSLATKNEIDAKADEHPEPVRDGGLIGEIATKGSQDFQLRETPDGWVLPFRVKAGRQSQIVIAEGAIAHALAALGKIGDRVTVFGPSVDKTFPKGDAFIAYTEIHVERIVGPDYSIPTPEVSPLAEAESAPMFTPAELEDVLP